MEQLGEPASEILEAEHDELSKPQTVAALEEADFAAIAPSEKTKTPNWGLTCKGTECPVH